MIPKRSRTGRAQRFAAATAATLAAALLLAGCAPATGGGSGSGDAAKPVSGGQLKLGRAASVDSLDLNQQITANNAFAIDQVFEPLVSFDETGKIVPWLAEKYEIDQAGLVYTFTLRSGVQFSDGTPVTPEDVVFSLQRHLKVGGPLPLEAPIASIAPGSGDAAKHTVVITLKQAYTPFLSELSGFANGIFPKDFGGKTEAEFFQKPVGTGPFAVKSWDPNGDLVFTKNTHYWQSGKPYLDTLVYTVVPDDTQLQQQLTAGQIDAIEDVPASAAKQLESGAATKLVKNGSWEIEQLFFNTQDPRFADEHVRRAIAHALDRDGITKATTFGTAKVANSLIPPTIEYSADAEKGIALGFDAQAAKDELAKSKYPKGFETTLLIASGNSQRAQIAQIVQEALAKIGITVKIEQIDLAAFRERFKAYKFDFMINSGQSDAPDPNGLVTFQADPEGFSKSYWTHYTDAKVTELMHEGRTTADGDARKKIYVEIQRILAQQVPYIPLFYPSNLKATTAKVRDLVVRPNGSIRFQDAWIAKG